LRLIGNVTHDEPCNSEVREDKDCEGHKERWRVTERWG